MGKGFGYVKKYMQKKSPYPSPNRKFVVPPRSLFTSQHDSNNDYSVTVISHKQPSSVSNLTTTTQIDTDSNNYGDTQYIATPILKNL